MGTPTPGEAAYELHGIRVLEFLGHGAPPRTAKDATDLIGAAWTHKAELIVLPADWLGDDFFRLSAGEVVQKLQRPTLTRGCPRASVGDRRRHRAARGRQHGAPGLGEGVQPGRTVWFVAGREELAARLAPA